jgi:hypothetical protein
MNSAAEIIRSAIVAEGLGVLISVSPSGEWPVFAAHLPDSLDNAICVYDTPGVREGRIQETGKSVGKPGWQVRVRSVDYADGIAKIGAIADYFDTVLRLPVEVGAFDYVIQAITQTGTILPLGQNNDEKRRYHFTLNGTITYT